MNKQPQQRVVLPAPFKEMMLFVFPFDPIDSRMYVLIGQQGALVIDPCINDAALSLLRKHRLSEVKILLTHEHYDHISGVNWLREKFDTEVICSAKCGKNIEQDRLNGSRHFDTLFLFQPEIRERLRASGMEPYVCHADVVFEGTYEAVFYGYSVRITETPGHSGGSVCIQMDETLLFTGDSLLKDAPTITRLPGGNTEDYHKVTKEYLRTLPADCFVLPGHGPAFYLYERGICDEQGHSVDDGVYPSS